MLLQRIFEGKRSKGGTCNVPPNSMIARSHKLRRLIMLLNSLLSFFEKFAMEKMIKKNGKRLLIFQFIPF